MPRRTTSFDLPDDLYDRLRIAASAVGETASDYIRDSISAALQRHADRDPGLAAHFRYLDERRLADIAEDARMQRELSQRINGKR